MSMTESFISYFPFSKFYEENKKLPIGNPNIEIVYREAFVDAIHDKFNEKPENIESIKLSRFEHNFITTVKIWLNEKFLESKIEWEFNDYNYYDSLVHEYRLIINYLEDREEFVEEKLKNSGADIRKSETVRYPIRNDYYNSELSADSLKILFWAFEYDNSKIFNKNVRKKDISICFQALTGYARNQYLKDTSGMNVTEEIRNPEVYNNTIRKLKEVIEVIEEQKDELI